MESKNRRILLIDDNRDIHEDFRKILAGGESQENLHNARAAFFGDDDEEEKPKQNRSDFELTSAYQGQEGVELLQSAMQQNRPFAMAFVDVRMPPGMDGLQTIKNLWKADPDMQVVICTAYSDYSFEEIIEETGNIEQLLILKKPFDPVEVRQLAGALTEKWNVIQRERSQLEELREANIRAEAANKAKSQFLTNMSHEIRTPMNAILGYVDLLCDPSTTAEERSDYGDTIRRSGKHLLTILNDILDLSKIEAGHMQIVPGDFQPFDTAREVATLLRPQAAEKDLELSLVTDGPIPRSFRTDSVRVRQILLNVMGNAIKFTQHGTVELQMSMGGTQGSERPELHFHVVDTGVGIAADVLPKLFDAFIQADMSNTRKVGGTGLGLAISKRLASMMGGSLEVQSEPEKGSTFSLRIPVESEELELVEYDRAECDLNRREGGLRDGSSMPRMHSRVLIVEDGKFNQALLSAVLRKAGAQVVVADNGLEGCEVYDQAQRDGQAFDLILMDMQMPILDGYEATARLRAEGCKLPIVALTAHAMSGDREKCLEAGCDEYVTKPLDRQALLELCVRLVAQPEPEAALPSRAAASEKRPA